ncbi:MAG: formylglycine-generating enzyme family protein [Ardenticatenaceae bacterium]|nr:formylglycine-generating enzyme family protein [Ardenticatenaceae bacterium]MCB8972791.1 formylglycine-generating enzyme family protein [Ardenticatenaceae bacterium]
MNKNSTTANPYHLNGYSNRLFFGRQSLFAWLLDQTAPELTAEKPIILHGPAKIGKTAVLKQLEAGSLNPPFLGIYIDFAQLALDSLSALYWDIANVGLNTLARYNTELDTLNHTDFIADPVKALQQQFLIPTEKILHEKRPFSQTSQRRLLFLFDNTHLLLEQSNTEALPTNTLTNLHQHLTANTSAHAIFAITDLPNESTINHPALQDGLFYALPPLNEEEAVALVRQPIPFILVQDVAEYIYQITQGHPQKIHKLCHAIYEHQEQYNLSQITVADVATVHKFANPNGSNARPTYNLQGSQTVKQAFRLMRRPDFWRSRSFVFLLVAVLLLATSILLFTLAGNSPISQQVAGFFGITTSTPTAVPDPPTPIVEVALLLEPTATQTPLPTATPTSLPTDMPTMTPTASATSTATATATPDRYPSTMIRQQDGMEMVLIPAATFLMGAAEGDFSSASDERPTHEVNLHQFYIDKYEVTVEQYAAFLNRLGSYARACEGVDCAWPQELAGYTSYLAEQDIGDGSVQFFAITGFANYPINHVSWFGAQMYCESVGARLPTEAEWEYAARGTDGRIYPWGNLTPDPASDLAVFQSDSYEDMKPVNALPNGASPFGVFGMAGSLWEWTADWYNETYYSESERDNPTGPETGFARVIRGGAWPFNNQADRLRATNRNSLSPDFISSAVGFRCAHVP